MKKEKAKKCLKCEVFTDSDEKYCPRYGETEGHDLREVRLRLEDMAILMSQGRFFTKHIVAFEGKFAKQKRPA